MELYSGWTMVLLRGITPERRISATEIAKGCRRMAGFSNKKLSLID